MPGVFKVNPLIQAWEPASTEVNSYLPGRIAAGSELVKLMRLLIIVSRVPLIVAVTVTVKGVPAVATEGAVKLRTACGLPQPRGIASPRTALSAYSERRNGTVLVMNQQDLSSILSSKNTEDGTGLVIRSTTAVAMSFQS